MANEVSNTVLLRDVRFSYLTVFVPKAVTEGSKEKYSLTALIPKEGKWAAKNKAAVDEVIARLIAKVKADPANKGKLPKDFKIPLKDGDTDLDEPDVNYEGHWYIAANSDTKPDVLSTEKDQNDKFKIITSADGIKSGDHGHVTINFFDYAKAGNKGIGAGLNNLMKTRDGVSLAGKRSGQSDFQGIELDDDDDSASTASTTDDEENFD